MAKGPRTKESTDVQPGGVMAPATSLAISRILARRVRVFFSKIEV